MRRERGPCQTAGVDRSPTDVTHVTDQLLALAGLADTADEDLRFVGPPTVLPSSYRVTEAATALVAAVSVAVARLAAVRASGGGSLGGAGGRPITIDSAEACAAFQSERHFQLTEPPRLWDELSGHYETEDGHVQFHTNFPHHRAALLTVTGCSPSATRADVESIVARAGRFELEQRVCDAGGIAAALRTVEEWNRHPHAAHVAGRPPLLLTPASTATATEPTRTGKTRTAGHPNDGTGPQRPLAGVRVLDLTRVIAGPVAARTLAAYGADVLRIGADRLPVVDSLLPDTTLGKRFAHCDITTSRGRDRLLRLAAEADVVISGFRPGALAARGVGHDDLLEANPDLILARLSAFGADGPWGGRRGFDSITQTTTGVVATETKAFGAERPRPLPCQLLDHGSGFLVALGVVAGLIGRMLSGRGGEIDVSLLTTRNWVDSLGPTDPRAGTGLAETDVAPFLETRPSPFGELRHVRHPGRIDGIEARWDRGPARPGADGAHWL